MSLLELQVTDIQQDVSNLDENVDFLFDEQVIQDERLLNLETETEAIEEEVEGLCPNNWVFPKLQLNKFVKLAKLGKNLATDQNFDGLGLWSSPR